MSSTNKTANYELSQFVGTDIPSILNDYNGDMRKIDTAIKAVANAEGSSASDIAGLQATVGQHTTEISGLSSTVNNVSGRVISVESKIPANASESNKLITAEDIPEIPSIEGLETSVAELQEEVGDISGDVKTIQLCVPANASESNKLVTNDDIAGLVSNLTERVYFTATPESGETYAQILQRVMNHMPPVSVPTSLIRIKIGNRIFLPTYDTRGDWYSFGLESGNLDIQALHFILSGCTYTGLSSSTSSPYFENFDFSSNSAQAVTVSVIEVE